LFHHFPFLAPDLAGTEGVSSAYFSMAVPFLRVLVALPVPVTGAPALEFADEEATTAG